MEQTGDHHASPLCSARSDVRSPKRGAERAAGGAWCVRIAAPSSPSRPEGPKEAPRIMSSSCAHPGAAARGVCGAVRWPVRRRDRGSGPVSLRPHELTGRTAVRECALSAIFPYRSGRHRRPARLSRPPMCCTP
eukprot:3661582-Prymnesium_polylepis.1